MLTFEGDGNHELEKQISIKTIQKQPAQDKNQPANTN